MSLAATLLANFTTASLNFVVCIIIQAHHKGTVKTWTDSET